MGTSFEEFVRNNLDSSIGNGIGGDGKSLPENETLRA